MIEIIGETWAEDDAPATTYTVPFARRDYDTAEAFFHQWTCWMEEGRERMEGFGAEGYGGVLIRPSRFRRLSMVVEVRR